MTDSNEQHADGAAESPGTPQVDATAVNANAPRQQGTGHLYELDDVERRYVRGGSAVLALKDVSLNIRRAEMVSIEGPSGSGKSTLLQLLGALDSPTKGSVRFNGEELGRASDGTLTDVRARQIGFVFQQFNLIPTLSALGNVAIASVPLGASRHQRDERAAELLTQVGLGERLDHLPSRLSGGEMQRVAIARALANAPSVILADEPTGNLDAESAAGVMELLVRLQAEDQVTLVIATHDEDVARRAQRRVKLRNGAVTNDTRPA